MVNPLEQSTKLLKQFLYSQYFSDGLRITLGVLLPSFICFQYNLTETGIAISLGALCVSIPDNPGPPDHRRNAMLVTAGLSFLMAFTTAILTSYTWLLAIFIAGSCFLFSMLHVFGARAASVGVSVLIIMVLGIDTKVSVGEAFYYSTLILTGGLWYFVLSILSQTLLPYRAAEQVLGECIFQLADFVRIKAAFYKPETNIDDNYKRMLEQQVVVNQYQESVRDILFRTRKLLRDTTQTGRKLLLTFVDLMDLYDEIMIRNYKYAYMQKQYANTDILIYFNQVIIQIAEELEHLGTGFHNHERVKPIHNFVPRLTVLKQKIDEAEAVGVNVLLLKKVLVNLRNIATRLNRIYEYDFKPKELPEYRNKELTRFVDHQLIDWKLFIANISRSSNHFRHAARVSIVCLLAFIFTQTVSEGPHSYWIILTAIVILKPGFSLTRQRNIERIIGTVAGGLIGLGVLSIFPTDAARFGFLVLFMLLTYSFIRIRYVVSVLFMTPYILIVFSFTTNYADTMVAWERIIDTLIGAGAAFAASYFVFPSWESYQLKQIVSDMLKANVHYFQKVIERDMLNNESQSAYRLARKELYVSTAHLTTAFQRMLSEPKSKQKQADALYRFVVLNHQLSSYMATLSATLQTNNQLSNEQLKQLRSAWYILKEASEKIDSEKLSMELIRPNTSVENSEMVSAELLNDLYSNAVDIRKSAGELIL